ncbi:hypothetical protein Q3G72_018223 [Acer saccharum]|nr:hypothetical protein Q3G72_018223 [Acer saccharum]
MVLLQIKIKKYKPTSSGSSGSFTHDAIGAILGREQNERVRGLGFGAIPLRVTLQEHNKSYVAHLEKQLRDLKEQFAEFQSHLFQQMSFREEQYGREDTQKQDVGSETQNFACTSKFQKSSITSKYNIQNVENVNCKLLDWMGTEKVVGEGKISSKDPTSKVHHIPLGLDYWKIAVTRAIVKDKLPPNFKFLVM